MRLGLLLPLVCLCLLTVVGCRPSRQLVARKEMSHATQSAHEVARDSVTTLERAVKGIEVEWWGSPMPKLPTPPVGPMSDDVPIPTDKPTLRGGYKVRISEEAQVSAQRSEAHALESQHLTDNYAGNYLLQRGKSTGNFCLGIYFGLGLGLLVALLVIGVGRYVKRWISNYFFN